MFILQRIMIRQHERGLLFRDGDFERLLAPGRHWVFGLSWRTRVERVSVREARFRMRTLMNRVTEARKAAEANLIVRREETAAMRSQVNTAKILESNPTLMKLRELEVLEKVADKANLSVVLTETGLSDRVLKLV
jgi:regulator of protease activity HflC (stomatin/prohibitin superfamily)